MKIVMLADTHMQHEQAELPKGDVLIHCGDFCSSGNIYEFELFAKWFDNLNYKHKILIAGNHDCCAEWNKLGIKNSLVNTTYLENERTIIDGVKFWGSPVTAPFNEWAFNWPSDMRKALYGLVPNDIDVMITHGPPFNILDKTDDGYSFGCVHLREAIERINPKLHCFGHLHPSYGSYHCFIEGKQDTEFVNCSLLNDNYKMVNKPIVFEV
jgi:Icc-related predicted phosphoesterase